VVARIVTVTPNAALDCTLWVDELRIGGRHCATGPHERAGGKGVNVARVLTRLGCAVHAVVLVGGETGARIARDLARSAIPASLVPAPGDSRSCLELLEEGSGRATQLHGPGVEADATTPGALVAAVEAALPGADWLAVCGSLPRGLDAAVVPELVERARARGVRVGLDASGAALRLGWEAAPDLIRVNREEASAVLDAPFVARNPPRDTPGPAARGVVSDGAARIVAWERGGPTWHVVPPRVRVRNPIGCGDAMLAGLLAGLGAGHPFPESLCFATALAAAEAEAPCAGDADPGRARALTGKVRLERLADGAEA
jgi:tagatose 6-phosphate kinase